MESLAPACRKFGIRMAVGAARGSVLWLVFRDSLTMVLVGALIGSLVALAATRTVTSLLFGVGAHDALSIVSAGVVLAVTATIATLLPARRAAHVDPVLALRYE
jgi:putative ABC transport system permease protein